MKLSRYLYLGFGAMILLTVILSVVSIVLINDVSAQFHRLRDESIANSLYALEMRTAVFQVQQWLTDASATGWTDGYEEAEQWAKTYREQSALLKSNLQRTGDIESLADVQEADAAFEIYYTAGKRMADAYVAQGREAGNAYMKEFDGTAEDIGQRIAAINAAEATKRDGQLAALEATVALFYKSVITALAAALLIGLLIAYYISRSIAGPVERLEGEMRRIAKGDLTKQAAIETAVTELRSLAESFERMRSQMALMISKIKGTTNNMAAGAEQLSASAQEVNGSVEQVSSTIQEIAKGAQDLSRNSSSAVQRSKATESSAKKGSQAAKAVNEQMTVIGASTKEGAERILVLGETSKRIGDIVQTINGISEQTNLLALNAAIEAARAGDAGRGFAVVADEVRKLAEESKKATTQITDMITHIQAEINNSVTKMGSNVQQVDQNARSVGEALAAFEEIPALVDQVNKAITEISAVAQENAAGAEEVSASVEQVTSAMQEVATTAQSLAGAAEELKSLIAGFTIDESQTQTPYLSVSAHPISPSRAKPSQGPMVP